MWESETAGRIAMQEGKYIRAYSIRPTFKTRFSYFATVNRDSLCRKRMTITWNKCQHSESSRVETECYVSPSSTTRTGVFPDPVAEPRNTSLAPAARKVIASWHCPSSFSPPHTRFPLCRRRTLMKAPVAALSTGQLISSL